MKDYCGVGAIDGYVGNWNPPTDDVSGWALIRYEQGYDTGREARERDGVTPQLLKSLTARIALLEAQVKALGGKGFQQ